MTGGTSIHLGAKENVETETTSGERRPSVVTLQNMLRKVSQSPFNNRPPDGASESPARKNPFYDYYLQSGTNGHPGDDTGTTASQGVDVGSRFTAPPELARWPETETSTNGQTSATGQNATATDRFPNATVDRADLFQTSPVHMGTLSQTSAGSDLFRAGVEDLFKPAEKEETFPVANTKEVDLFGGSQRVPVDPFKPSEKVDDLFWSTQPAVGNMFHAANGADLFQAAPTKSEELSLNKESPQDLVPEKDLFGPASKRNMDPFSTSSTDTVDPFQSPITKNLFQDVSSLEDPFGSPPFKQEDPFKQDFWSGTRDIFQPFVSEGSSEVTQGRSVSEVSYFMPLIISPAGTKPDTLSSPGLLKKKPSRPGPPPVPPKPSQKPPLVVLTTPGESEWEVLPPTPFSRGRNLAMSSVRSPVDRTHVQTSKRPPKPLPRTKPPQAERPPQPAVPVEPEPSLLKEPLKPVFKPPPKPVLRLKPKTPDGKKVEPQDFVVLEDILLTGPEACVEDWPEDSPQFDPDFKPSGRLRLRRESLKMKMEAEGGTDEDQDPTDGSTKKKDKKSRMSMLTRRSSKEKLPGNMVSRSGTLPIRRKSSRDYFLDPRGSAGEAEDDNPVEKDHKKKPLRTKVNELLRRSSTSSFRKQAKEYSPQEWRDDGTKKKKANKKDSVRRWSEGTVPDGSTGEDEDGVQQREKQKKKIQFVRRRGYTFTTSNKVSDESKGACGYSTPKGSKADMFEVFESQKMKGAGSMDDLDQDQDQDQDPYHFYPQDELTGTDLSGSKETLDHEWDQPETCKPKKPLKPPKKCRSMKDPNDFEGEDPPGATCSGYLSEAARAEWYAAQKDARGGLEDEDEEEEEDGDTDSLMEWWNTVEQWDEVPSDEEDHLMKEDELKSFQILADKVERGLRVFIKVFIERAEVLWHSILTIDAIADDISEFHQKAKIAGITGGTTTAVGGVTAIAGLALVPVTFGASLLITAIGVGVATAGGITSASAAISDNVNNMNDRKKVEVVLQDYEGHLLEIGKILHFIDQGLYKLRTYEFLRSGTQHYSADWETRRAVQMISQVDKPVTQAKEGTDAALASLQGLFKGMDKYFVKESRELKKGCKKEVVAQIKDLVSVLTNALLDLNDMRKTLEEVTGM